MDIARAKARVHALVHTDVDSADTPLAKRRVQMGGVQRQGQGSLMEAVMQAQVN